MNEAAALVGEPRFGGILVVADHASNYVPDDVALGVDSHLMQQHIAVDIGVAGIAERMAMHAGCAAYLAAVSRLVCDFNRDRADPAAIPETSDGVPIAGNRGIDREARLSRFWDPFHQGLEDVLDACPQALTLFLHSYTPSLSTRPDEMRPWHCGVLYDQDARGARAAIPLLAADGLVVGDQEPYSGAIYNSTIRRHAEDPGRPYLYLEIRQDLIADARGQEEWAKRLLPLCNQIALAIA